MDKPNEKILDLALRLTGSKKFDCDNHWQTVPANWSCPICKRSKLHITKPDKNKTLKGSLANHHDHIEQYVQKKSKEIRKDNENIEIDEKIGWFIKYKISNFLNRFEKSLVCEDCNNADTHAKSMISDVCKYFSFSPKEIAQFIQPDKHKPHLINYSILKDIYIKVVDTHEYRKDLADVLINRALSNNRVWGDTHNFANIGHYKAAQKIIKNKGIYDGSLILDLNINDDTSVKNFSKYIEKQEKKKHRKSNQYNDSKWLEKEKRKNSIKKSRELSKSYVDPKIHINHGKLWSKKDIEYIRVSYEKETPLSEVSQNLGRLESSIISRLKRLGYEIQE